MINEHESIIIGVYWDDVGIYGWKLWGWLGSTEFITSSYGLLSSVKLIVMPTFAIKNCKEYSKGSYTFLEWYLRSSQDGWADMGCCLLLHIGAWEWMCKSQTCILWSTDVTTVIFLWISTIMMLKPVNKGHLLYKIQVFCFIQQVVSKVLNALPTPLKHWECCSVMSREAWIFTTTAVRIPSVAGLLYF